jgi:GNAT superfamily N-acetyltransferase
MSKVIPKRISYKELRDGAYLDAYISQDEKFDGVASMTPFLREAMCNCPINNDDTKTAMYLMLDDGKEVGRCYMYGTMIKAGDSTYEGQVFFGLEALEEYRGEGVGTSLLLFPLTNNEYDFVLVGGMTTMVVPMYRKMKYQIFEVPQFVKLMNARYFLIPLGMKGGLLKLATMFCNEVIKLLDIPARIKLHRLLKKCVIKKEAIVPIWAGELAVNDGHKYMELHDRAWLQWNLDYNSHGYKDDVQSYYSVYDNDGKPLGFFMTNERLKKTEGRIKDSIRAKLLEWGSFNLSVLSEADINLLALSTYSPQVDLVMSVSDDTMTANKLRRMGFVQRGFFPVGIKDKKNVLKDVGDQSLWRLRFGYTNTIIY